MATQTLTNPALAASYDNDVEITRPAQPWLRRLLDFIITTQTHRAQRAIAMHMRSRGLEFRALDAQQPPH